MIDLDPRWRLVIILVALGVIPLLLALGWIARKVRDSYTTARDSYTTARDAYTTARDAYTDMLLLRSSHRAHLRRRRKRRRHASTPSGPGRAPDAPGPAGRHFRRNP